MTVIELIWLSLRNPVETVNGHLPRSRFVLALFSAVCTIGITEGHSFRVLCTTYRSFNYVYNTKRKVKVEVYTVQSSREPDRKPIIWFRLFSWLKNTVWFAQRMVLNGLVLHS